MFALEASDWMVVVTSMTLVFLMLIALCLLITLQGKLFDSLKAKKQSAAPKATGGRAAPKPQPKPQPQPAATVTAAPAAAAPTPKAVAAPSGGISPEIVAVLTAAVRAADEAVPPEIVAAIAAAVHEIAGEGAVIHGIRRVGSAPAGRRRGRWGDAGVYEVTTPFM